MTLQAELEAVGQRSDLSLVSIFQRTTQIRGMVHVSNLLGNVIDFDESINADHVVIRTGVSELLDQARLKYEDLDNILAEVAWQLQERHPSLDAITVQYIPQVGYVICCDSPTTLPGFVFQFQEDDSTFFYKESCCRELDSSIGDIFGYVLDIQRELVEELIVALLSHEHIVQAMNESVATLDCFLALANCAKSYHWSRYFKSSFGNGH